MRGCGRGQRRLQRRTFDHINHRPPHRRTPTDSTATAPPVTVTNQVHPAAVDVTLNATLPKRISETTVERDAQRNIVKSVTVEKDA